MFDETYDYLSRCRCGCGSINSFYELPAGAIEHHKTGELFLVIEREGLEGVAKRELCDPIG